MRTQSPKRFASFLITLLVVSIPAVVGVLTAGPMGCGGSGCMGS